MQITKPPACQGAPSHNFLTNFWRRDSHTLFGSTRKEVSLPGSLENQKIYQGPGVALAESEGHPSNSKTNP